MLRTVFDSDNYPVVHESENPDFVLKKRGQSFGVEITEFYPDQTSARLENKPGYVNEVINNRTHKDDVPLLEVVSMEYQERQTGKWKKIPHQGVKQENLSITDRLALLIRQINEKSDKQKSYEQGLAAIDLIIHDRRGSLLDGVNDRRVRAFFVTLRTQRIIVTKFRSIYLTTPVNRGIDTEVFILK